MRNAEKIRVLLVDDHVLVRQGLRKMLEADPRIEVGAASSATARARSKRPPPRARRWPSIDIGLPGHQRHRDRTSRIRRRLERRRRAHGVDARTTALHRRSLKAGAKGYVLKDAEELDLVRAVTTVARGERTSAPRCTAPAVGLSSAARRPPARLAAGCLVRVWAVAYRPSIFMHGRRMGYDARPAVAERLVEGLAVGIAGCQPSARARSGLRRRAQSHAGGRALPPRPRTASGSPPGGDRRSC